jgi:hypothetical protein
LYFDFFNLTLKQQNGLRIELYFVLSQVALEQLHNLPYGTGSKMVKKSEL